MPFLPNQLLLLTIVLSQRKKRKRRIFLRFYSLTAIKTLKSLLSVMSHTWMLLTGQIYNEKCSHNGDEKNIYFGLRMCCIYFDY